MQSDKNPLPRFDILKFPELDLLKLAKTIGGAAVGFFCLHQLSPISDHFNKVDSMLMSENISGTGQLDLFDDEL